MKKFDVSIEDENVVLRSSAGEVESIQINGGASFNLVRDNKLVLKIESPVVGANGLPLDHGGSDSQYEKDTDTVPYERKEIPSFASLATGDTLVTPYTPAAGYMYNSVNLAGCEDSQFARLTERWVRKHLKRKKKAAKKQEPVVLSSGDALHVSVTTVNGKATGFSQSVERGEGEGDKDATERIAQLEKEKAELQSANARLRKELVWQFEQLLKKIELVVKKNDRFNEKNRQACDRINDLETQNAQLQEKLTAAIEEVKSKDFLSEQLAQAAQRIKDLEREASKRNWPPRIRFYL